MKYPTFVGWAPTKRPESQPPTTTEERRSHFHHSHRWFVAASWAWEGSLSSSVLRPASIHPSIVCLSGIYEEQPSPTQRGCFWQLDPKGKQKRPGNPCALSSASAVLCVAWARPPQRRRRRRPTIQQSSPQSPHDCRATIHRIVVCLVVGGFAGPRSPSEGTAVQENEKGTGAACVDTESSEEANRQPDVQGPVCHRLAPGVLGITPPRWSLPTMRDGLCAWPSASGKQKSKDRLGSVVAVAVVDKKEEMGRKRGKGARTAPHSFPTHARGDPKECFSLRRVMR